MAIPLSLHRSQPLDAQAHHRCSPRRHGARRVRVRRGADARRGPARRRWSSTGQPDNDPGHAARRRREIQSGVERDQAAHRRVAAGGRAGADGARMVSKETVVLIALPQARLAAGRRTSSMRGLSPHGHRAAAAGARSSRAACSGPASRRSSSGSSIAQRFAGRRHRRAAALRRRDWTVVGIFDAGGSGVRLRDLGRRRAADAVVPPRPAYSSVIARLADAERLRRAQAAARVRPAAHARREARARLLRGAVAGAVDLHQHPRAHALDDLLDRRDDRRDDHDVRGGREPHRRDRHAARARLPPPRHPHGVSRRVDRCSAAMAAGPGARVRLAHAVRAHLDAELAVVRASSRSRSR